MTATSPDDPGRWTDRPTLIGHRVRLEPLGLHHAPGLLLAAQADGAGDEVFRWLAVRVPHDDADALAVISSALDAMTTATRYPLAQIDVQTGAFIGSTSLYEVVPSLRTVAIGHTWLGRPWWRTGHNTEAKLLLMTHCFDTLGAVRVVWHTDIYNTRSQAAIARLGATREGILRKHRIRLDGSWRDTVQYSMTDDDWPAVRDRLSARLIAD